MNVHHLTPRAPGRVTQPYAAVESDGAGQGARAVTAAPFNLAVAAQAYPSRPGDETPRPFQLAVSFPADLSAIAPLRRELSNLLCRHGLTRLVGTVALASQELMANAVLHGCREYPPDTKVTVTATCDGQRVRLSVQDPSPKKPCLSPVSEDAEGGRGLVLVAALADRWGVAGNSEGDGKAVWMEVAC